MPRPFSHRAQFRALAPFLALAQGDVSARAPFMASVQGRVGARGTDLGRFWADLGSIWGEAKCLERRQGRVAEHFSQI